MRKLDNSDAGRDWGQEEKGTMKDEMAGWHHWLDGRESEWTPGVGDGQGGLACCDSWGRKELDTTERLIWSDLMCKRMKLEHFLTPYTKTNSKRIKDLNVRPETIKLLELNIGRTLYDINHSNILYDRPPGVMGIKTKINIWSLIKL